MSRRQDLPAVELEFQLLDEDVGTLSVASVDLAQHPMGERYHNPADSLGRNFASGDQDNGNQRPRVPTENKIFLGRRLLVEHPHVRFNYDTRSLNFHTQFRPSTLQYLYLGNMGGPGTGPSHSARDISCVLQHCPNLEVLKTRALKISGDQAQFFFLAQCLRRLRHVSMTFTACSSVSAWRHIAEEGLKYVPTVELFGDNLFKIEQFRALVSAGSKIQSLTLHGASAREAITNSVLPFLPLILNNAVIKAIYLAGYFIPVGSHKTLQHTMRSCIHLETLSLQVRSKLDAIGIVEEAGAHPALANLSMIFSRIHGATAAAIPGPADWSVLQGKMITMLKRNDKIKTLRFVVNCPNRQPPVFDSIVRDGVATELEVNQIGRVKPSGDSPEAWRAACLNNNFSIGYHFMREGGIQHLIPMNQSSAAASPRGIKRKR